MHRVSHLTVVQVEESADLAHDVQRIALNLHSSHRHHVSGDSQRLLLRHFGGRGQRVTLYAVNDSNRKYGAS